jgi:WhiB family redox-sensing transcriptional regulator
MTAHAPERPLILAELAARPGQTAFEVGAGLGQDRANANRIARLVTRMWQAGDLAAGTAFRPLQGRDVRIFAVAVPGTPPPARPETDDQVARRRELNRRQKARSRAARRPRTDHRITTKAEIGPAAATAACRTAAPDLFFGPDGEGTAERRRRVPKAQAVCFTCPIRVRCLQVATANRERFGVWGGADFQDHRATPQTTRPDATATATATASAGSQ